MMKLTLALVACVLTAAAAKGDSIAVTGPLGTLPVGTSASVNIITSITTTGGVFSTFVDVTSGPDAGIAATFGFMCGPSLVPILCVDNVFFTYVNTGTPGVDTVTASLIGSTLTGSGTVTWGTPTGTPEPGTLSLLAAALAVPLALRRRIAR